MATQEIKKVAVIGAGLMGFGIGVEFARFGYPVSIYNTSAASSKQAMQNSKESLDLMAENELITADEAAAAYARLRPTTDIAEAAVGADYIAESVLEVLTLKQEIMAKLDELCPPNVILATNSSGMLVANIAANTKHPERVVAAHYYQPAHFVPFVEVSGGPKSDQQAVERTANLLRGLRKRVAVIEPERPGYIGNRIQGAIGREIRAMIEQGICTPEMIDDAIIYGFGRRMGYTGHFIRTDLIGLDFGYVAAKGRGQEPWKPIKERVERGELGMKSGKGFYDWPGDSAKEFHRQYNSELIRLMKRDMEKGEI